MHEIVYFSAIFPPSPIDENSSPSLNPNCPQPNFLSARHSSLDGRITRENRWLKQKQLFYLETFRKELEKQQVFG